MAWPQRQLVEYIQENKLKTLPFITDTANVIIGETGHPSIGDWDDYDETKYPRLETLVDRLKGDGYVDQACNDEALRLSIAGYLYDETNELPYDERMYLCIERGEETLKSLRSLNMDKMMGSTPPVPEIFLQVGAFYSMDFEYEFIEHVDSFLIHVEYKTTVNFINREV